MAAYDDSSNCLGKYRQTELRTQLIGIVQTLDGGSSKVPFGSCSFKGFVCRLSDSQPQAQLK